MSVLLDTLSPFRFESLRPALLSENSVSSFLHSPLTFHRDPEIPNMMKISCHHIYKYPLYSRSNVINFKQSRKNRVTVVIEFDFLQQKVLQAGRFSSNYFGFGRFFRSSFHPRIGYIIFGRILIFCIFMIYRWWTFIYWRPSKIKKFKQL